MDASTAALVGGIGGGVAGGGLAIGVAWLQRRWDSQRSRREAERTAVAEIYSLGLQLETSVDLVRRRARTTTGTRSVTRYLLMSEQMGRLARAHSTIYLSNEGELVENSRSVFRAANLLLNQVTRAPADKAELDRRHDVFVTSMHELRRTARVLGGLDPLLRRSLPGTRRGAWPTPLDRLATPPITNVCMAYVLEWTYPDIWGSRAVAARSW